jgi:16S rRNA (adenine1518-N6/adenine1519-N6)-dimethyltransferase
MTSQSKRFSAGSSKRPKLGQHFLINSEFINHIVESAEITPSHNVVEIGPGKGALTSALARVSSRLTLIEPDVELARKLELAFPAATVAVQKAEEFDFRQLDGPVVIVSNLPYYASVHIYKHLTEQKENISRMVLMFQKEVAQRISAAPGGRHYGSLSVWTSYNWETENVLSVPATAFNPPPKVASAVLKFIPKYNKKKILDEEALFRLVRASFVHKRRTIGNNLKNIYTHESLEAALIAASLEKSVRAEEVSLEQFVMMSRIVKEI